MSKLFLPTILKLSFILQNIETTGSLWMFLFGTQPSAMRTAISELVRVLAVGFAITHAMKKRFLPIIIVLATIPKFRLGVGRPDADRISLLGHIVRFLMFHRFDLKLPPVHAISALRRAFTHGLWKRHISEHQMIRETGTKNGALASPLSRYDITRPATFVMFTADPIDVETVLTDKEAFPTRGFTGFSDIVGFGLLGMPSGEQHSAHRRIVGQFLSENHLKDFSTVFGEEIQVMLHRWLDNPSKSSKVNVQYDLSMLTLDCIMRAGFGVDKGNAQFLRQGMPEKENVMAHGLDEVLKEIVVRTALVGYSSIPSPRQWHINGLIELGRKLQAELFEYAIAKAKAHPEEKTMLSEMLKLRSTGDADAKMLTDEEIGDELQTIRGAGHETTSNTLTWSLLLLAQNPHEFDVLRQEADEIIAGDVCTYDEAKKCHKHFCAVLETLRLYPTVPSFPREAHKDVVLPSGYDVPAGSLIFISQRAMNRDPDTWSRPDDFVPSRFDMVKDVKMGVPVGNVEAGFKFGFAPFGAANRSCIGQRLAILEAVQILATLTKRCDFNLLTKNVVEVCEVTLGPKSEGLWFEVAARGN